MAFNPRDYYYIYDKPVPYKQGKPDELLLYPVKMREYLEFHVYASCLLLEKNTIPDPRVISMSYFEFMLLSSNDENQLIQLFDGLLRLVLRKPNMVFEVEYEPKKPIFKIDGHIYTASDFDNIKALISEQNLYDLPNELVQKKIRDKLLEARRLREQLNNSRMASLEDQMIAVAIYTHMTFEEICELTIRKFIKTLHRADHILHSKIYLSASLSGFVEFKDKSAIKHWLAELETDEMKGATVDLDEMQSKINSGISS